MTARRLTGHEAAILAERDRAETKALSESSSPLIRELETDLDRKLGGCTPSAKQQLGFKATIDAFRRASLCSICGKSKAVLNVASRGFRAERVTPDSHCICPNGPVDLQSRGELQTLEVEK